MPRDGCQAAVHAAAIFSLDPRRAEDMRRTNALATELVLGGAVSRGLDPVIHVSTTVALARYGGSGPDLPLGDIDLPYAQSKIASEKIARGLQAEGAPVAMIYRAQSMVRTIRTGKSERTAAVDAARPLPDLSSRASMSLTCVTSPH